MGHAGDRKFAIRPITERAGQQRLQAVQLARRIRPEPGGGKLDRNGLTET